MLLESKIIAAGIASVGMGLAAIGIGLVFSSFISGTSRNPSLENKLFSLAILSFAITEAAGLFCLMMAFFLLYAF
jgi:F-type H+-transporting ATPase subunit c